MRRFATREDGTTMVEFAICISLFMLIFFATLDFGRLGYNWVMAEKAMARAVRIAAVRPPVCAGVPSHNERADTTDATFAMGTPCRTATGLCANTVRQCTLNAASGSEGTAVASEIWTAIRPFLPDDATNQNVLISYSFDEQLGFLGGPFTPVMTAELVGPPSGGSYGDFLFTFMTPLSALAGAANASSTAGVPAEGSTIPFPDVSVSMPAEDLNRGNRG